MSVIFLFGVLGREDGKPMNDNRKKRQILFLSSNRSSIVKSQHDYFFIPTTEVQIII